MKPTSAPPPGSFAAFNGLVDFFKPKPGDIPCLGVALGRHAVWAAYRAKGKQGIQIEWCENFPLEGDLFSSEISPQTVASLGSALGALAKKVRGSFFNLQMALPDPAVSLEVFELEKIPVSGASKKEFLTWRFNQGRGPTPAPLAFTSQSLGEEKGKSLLLAMAVEQKLLDALDQAFQASGLQALVTDMAFSYRFNLLHGTFSEKAVGGALATFEPDYWSLAIWDSQIRPRFVRAKWWEKKGFRPQGPALERVVLEIERTIRSYVYSEKDRSVETLFILAPDEWREPLLRALNLRTGGKCVALSTGGVDGKKTAAAPDLISPSVLATVVDR